MVLLLVVDASSTTTPMPYPDITLHLLTFDNQQIHRHTSGYVTRELGNTALELQVLRTEMYSFNIGAKFDKVLYSSGTRLKWKIKLVLVTVIVVCYVLRYKAAIDFFSITVFKVEENDELSCKSKDVHLRAEMYDLPSRVQRRDYEHQKSHTNPLFEHQNETTVLSSDRPFCQWWYATFWRSKQIHVKQRPINTDTLEAFLKLHFSIVFPTCRSTNQPGSYREFHCQKESSHANDSLRLLSSFDHHLWDYIFFNKFSFCLSFMLSSQNVRIVCCFNQSGSERETCTK